MTFRTVAMLFPQRGRQLYSGQRPPDLIRARRALGKTRRKIVDFPVFLKQLILPWLNKILIIAEVLRIETTDSPHWDTNHPPSELPKRLLIGEHTELLPTVFDSCPFPISHGKRFLIRFNIICQCFSWTFLSTRSVQFQKMILQIFPINSLLVQDNIQSGRTISARPG